KRRKIVRRLDRPGEVDDAVRAAQQRDEVVVLAVRRVPLGIVEVAEREPPGQTDDLLDAVVGRQRANEARADVAARPGDDDAHYCFRPIARASSRFDIFERPSTPRRRARSYSSCFVFCSMSTPPKVSP